MKIAPKLLSAAFAFAAIVSTSLPMVQPAEAANGPDLEASTGPDAYISRNAADGGSTVFFASVKNVGTAKSVPTIMIKSCAYLPAPDGGRHVDWFVVDPMHNLVPALDPQGSAPDTKFTCPVQNGRPPVAARLTVAANQGDTNMANNKVTTSIFKLD